MRDAVDRQRLNCSEHDSWSLLAVRESEEETTPSSGIAYRGVDQQVAINCRVKISIAVKAMNSRAADHESRCANE